MSTAIQQVGNYLEIFTEFAKSAPGQNVPWLRKLREEAFARFCEAGFPTTHDEDWRFTNTSPIARTRFAFAKQLRALSRNDLNAWTINRAAARLVFIDGRFAPELSDSARFAGVQISSLKDQIASHPDELEPHLASYANIQRDAFCALNTAFIQDGTYIHVRRGTVLEQPVHLLFISIESDAPTMAHPRNLVVFEDESQGTVIEEYVSIGKGTALCNSVTELVVGENATVSHYMVECEHRDAFNVSTLRIQQARSANVASHSLLLGGGLVRNNVHPVLAGEGGECLINGLFVGDGRQHLDNYMYV
ncbi:MAG: SufD family Fe-S cluster assembly protein, partial [Acidobacteriaceae bacterium]|nr:SufD family Fe-S cluster assembly protein [Acidobacteriaceae bacterium]